MFVIGSFDALLQRDPRDVIVLSCVAPHLGHMEDTLVERKFQVYSISPHARHRQGVPLMVPEVNGVESMRLLGGGSSGMEEQQRGRLFKSPNCVSCGLSLVLDAIDKQFGLEAVSITTFQSLTGRGDAVYDAALVRGNILPLGRTVEDANRKIRQEIHDILGPARRHIKVSVTAQRVYSQRGHYVDVRVNTSQPIVSDKELAMVLEQYSPFANTRFAQLPDAPAHPIRVSLEPMWPRPVQSVALVAQDAGMAVHVGHICTDDEVFDASLSLVVDNLARGAYGAALLLAEFVEEYRR
jgi:aspartate-semialdehyde dehydrogenase